MDVASFAPNTIVDLSQHKRLQPKKVLVVEDDKNMTVLLGKALLDTSSDIEVHWAASLEQAVTQLIQNADINQKVPYDLIIADIFLEGNGTGLDLLHVINATYPKIPFLVISSIAEEQVKEALDETLKSNLAYLRKPFLFAQCKEQIKKILTDL